MSVLKDFYYTTKIPRYYMAAWEETSGTAAGAASAGVNTITFNTELADKSSGITLASNVFTVPAGTWRIEVTFCACQVDRCKAYMKEGTTKHQIGLSQYSNSGALRSQGNLRIGGTFTFASDTDLFFEAWVQTGKATNGLGNPVSNGNNERYANITFIDLERYHYE